MSHPIEEEVSRELKKIIPSAEMVRFGKNGTDANSAAIRLARYYTGRKKIAVCGYHGWQIGILDQLLWMVVFPKK